MLQATGPWPWTVKNNKCLGHLMKDLRYFPWKGFEEGNFSQRNTSGLGTNIGHCSCEQPLMAFDWSTQRPAGSFWLVVSLSYVCLMTDESRKLFLASTHVKNLRLCDPTLTWNLMTSYITFLSVWNTDEFCYPFSHLRYSSKYKY